MRKRRVEAEPPAPGAVSLRSPDAFPSHSEAQKARCEERGNTGSARSRRFRQRRFAHFASVRQFRKVVEQQSCVEPGGSPSAPRVPRPRDRAATPACAPAAWRRPSPRPASARRHGPARCPTPARSRCPRRRGGAADRRNWASAPPTAPPPRPRRTATACRRTRAGPPTSSVGATVMALDGCEEEVVGGGEGRGSHRAGMAREGSVGQGFCGPGRWL